MNKYGEIILLDNLIANPPDFVKRIFPHVDFSAQHGIVIDDVTFSRDRTGITDKQITLKVKAEVR